MAVTKRHETTFQRIKRRYAQFSFIPSDTFMWSPSTGQIRYIEQAVGNIKGIASLLHEVGHGLLGHETFESDLELVKLETDAWETALAEAKKLAIKINEEQVQDALDSYRDWLKKRSTCPECKMVSTQGRGSHYTCFNCGTKWKVSESQLCYARKRV